MIRRTFIAIILTTLIAGGILLVVFFDEVKQKTLDVAGEVATAVKGTVEEWTRDQIVRIARSHLGVEFTFEKFEVVRADSFRFHGVRFVDSGEPFIECQSLTVTLAEVPSMGQPIVIRTVVAQAPSVMLIARDDGSLLGWSNLIKRDGDEEFADGGSTALSDVFDIREIVLRGARLEYRPVDGSPPMVFDQLAMNLDVEHDEGGWYALATQINRPPVLDLAIDGRLNLDTAELDVREAVVHTTLARDQYAIFPPDIQEFLEAYEVVGDMTLHTSGRVPLSDAAQFRFGGDITLLDARFAADDFQLPIDELQARFDFDADLLQLHSIDAQLLGGYGQLSGEVRMNSAYDATLEYSFSNVEIARAIRETSGGETSMSGLLSMNGNAAASFANLLDSLTTTGDLAVEKGRLVRISIIGALIGALKGDASKTGNDTLTSRFLITQESPRVLKLRDIDLVSGAIAARGDGEIAFGGAINYRLNAGPLERVQSLLGPLGDILGSVTDVFVKYHVTGTLDEPVVSVKPLGIGADAMDDD